MTAPRALLVEIEVTSPAGETSTLRFTDRALRPFPPSDGLRPNLGYDDRLAEAPAIRRLLFDDLTTMKPALSVGALTLINADHRLDVYEGYGWGEIAVWLWTIGTPSADAQLILKGVCAPPGYAYGDDKPSRVKVSLADYSAELSKPLQTTLYAGTNDGVTVFYEGAADGLKGTPKPLAYGDLTDAQIPAPLVYSPAQAHQLHDGAIEGEVALFDRGDDFGLADDGDLSGAAFDAAVLAAAHYVTDLGRGLVQFNDAPVGQATFGFKGDNDAAAGGYVETAGPVLARLLARSGVLPGRIGASVAGLASTAVIGFYAGEAIALGDAVQMVAAGVPAAVLPDREGAWAAIAYGPPAADADYQLEEGDIINCASDDAAPLPVGEVRVGWGRIWRTFDGTDLAPALVGTDEQARLKDAYRWATAASAAVKALYPKVWRTLTVETALRAEADALALAAKLQAMFGLKDDGRPRRLWRLTLPIETGAAWSLGRTLSVTYPRQGLAGNYLLVGEEPLRPKRNQAVWTVWG